VGVDEAGSIRPPFLETLLGYLVPVSALLAAGAAVFGVRTWRRELMLKRRLEVAQKIVVRAFEFTDRFEWARNTSISTEPLMDDLRGRLRSLLETAAALRGLRFESMVDFPPQVQDELEKLNGYYTFLVRAFNDYERLAASEQSRRLDENQERSLREAEKVIHGCPQDELDNEVKGQAKRVSSMVVKLAHSGRRKPCGGGSTA